MNSIISKSSPHKHHIVNDYDSIPITTTVMMVKIEGIIVYKNAFFLLKIHRIPDFKIRSKRKIKIPHPGNSGLITSASYNGITRGIVKKPNGKPMKHTVILDISTKSQNVNLGVSASIIRVCGVTHDIIAIEAVNHLFDNLHWIQDELDYIQSHLIEAEQVINWLENNTKGDKYRVVKGTDILTDGDTFEEVFGLTYPNKIPYSIDNRIAKFMLLYFLDYVYDADYYPRHDHYCIRLKSILTIKYVIGTQDDKDKSIIVKSNEKLKILNIKLVMVNHTFNLGFEINRLRLAEEINQIGNFVANHDPNINKSVTINYFYTLPDELKPYVVDKRHTGRISLIVYKVGSVTLSGPCQELNKLVHDLFQSEINDIYYAIARKNSKPKKIKIRPMNSNNRVKHIISFRQNE